MSYTLNLKVLLRIVQNSPFGIFPQLEDEMCEWVPGEDKSPDRVDVPVWAVTKLIDHRYTGKPDLSKLILCIQGTNRERMDRTHTLYQVG
jgi:hypothetical protein